MSNGGEQMAMQQDERQQQEAGIAAQVADFELQLEREAIELAAQEQHEEAAHAVAKSELSMWLHGLGDLSHEAVATCVVGLTQQLADYALHGEFDGLEARNSLEALNSAITGAVKSGYVDARVQELL